MHQSSLIMTCFSYAQPDDARLHGPCTVSDGRSSHFYVLNMDSSPSNFAILKYIVHPYMLTQPRQRLS